MPNAAKIVAEAWRNLTPQERAVWEEKARIDRQRFEIEKSMYTGPWKVEAPLKWSKDPSAPKKPSSAYLSFANSKRALVKKMKPNVSNAEISKTLSDMWKSAPPDVKQPYIQKEARLREQYKIDIANWRAKMESEKDVQRKEREDLALKKTLELEHYMRAQQQVESAETSGSTSQHEGGLVDTNPDSTMNVESLLRHASAVALRSSPNREKQYHPEVDGDGDVANFPCGSSTSSTATYPPGGRELSSLTRKRVGLSSQRAALLDNFPHRPLRRLKHEHTLGVNPAQVMFSSFSSSDMALLQEVAESHREAVTSGGTTNTNRSGLAQKVFAGDGEEGIKMPPAQLPGNPPNADLTASQVRLREILNDLYGKDVNAWPAGASIEFPATGLNPSASAGVSAIGEATRGTLSTSSSAELLAELESAFLDDSLSDDAGVMGTEPLLDLEDEAEFFDY